MICDIVFRHFIRTGHLIVVDDRGNRSTFGDGTGHPVTIRLHGSLPRKLLIRPTLTLPEAYVDGQMTIEGATLRDFVALVSVNLQALDRENYMRHRGRQWLRKLLSLPKAYNPLGTAQRKVSHHYDLNYELFRLFLDSDMQYSMAYFRSPNDSLDQAQMQKKAHIAAKLLLKPQLKILDIGSGWGGLGLYLAQAAPDIDVTGVTLSREQYEVSNRRAQEAGLAHRVRFKLQDYRQETQQYDRIVSVGMLEHVGPLHYHEYFAKITALLAEDGVALVHSVGNYAMPGPISPWIERYIFPGAYTPTLAEVMPAVEASLLWPTDIEVLRLHYAYTLREWHRRFQENRARVAALYDERFCRMWELYLLGCEYAFSHQSLLNFQLQLAKRRDAVPLTRDYVTMWKDAQPAAAPLAAD